MGKTKQRPSGLVERTRTYDGKRVHFYGRRVAEVNAKIAAYEEERRRLEAAGPLFESVAPEWWELYPAAGKKRHHPRLPGRLQQRDAGVHRLPHERDHPGGGG